jgi:hypothetical protein
MTEIAEENAGSVDDCADARRSCESEADEAGLWDELEHVIDQPSDPARARPQDRR